MKSAEYLDAFFYKYMNGRPQVHNHIEVQQYLSYMNGIASNNEQFSIKKKQKKTMNNS
jgi:hypothetical protein